MRGDQVKAVAEDLAGVIGIEGAQRLMAALGGREIYVPLSASAQHPIAVALADEALTARFCEYYHGLRIEFPVNVAKRLRILSLSRAGWTSAAIATNLLVTQRFVRKVLAEAREGLGHNSTDRQPQPRLFD